MNGKAKVDNGASHLKVLLTKLCPYLSIFMIASATGSAATDASSELSAEIAKLWPYHASLVIVGFLLMVLGMTFARRKDPGWLKKHKFLGISGASIAAGGMLMAVYMIDAASQAHFRVPHAYLGSFVILLLIVTPALGILQLKAARENKSKIRRVHRIFGRIALLLMALNMLLGMLIVSSA